MLIITIPPNNINERIYSIDTIFNEFLGLQYKTRLHESSSIENHWEIELENGNKIIFEDHFFNKYQNELEYLQLKNIPETINISKLKFTVEDDIPIIYGKDKLDTVDGEEQKSIICGIDIFASSFFMLTRWEEYVNKKRDHHQRFSAFESLAFKANFLDRPIVNEYVELLWNMLRYLGIQQRRLVKKYKVYLTHDVDVLKQYANLKKIVKLVTQEGSLSPLYKKLKILCRVDKDPFDTFEYLMDIAENIGEKSYFFFMGEGKTAYDNLYKSNDPFIKQLIGKIKKRGHYIGIHPTYDAYNDSTLFYKEKEELEQNLNCTIMCGRNHYLRFEVPTSWQVWEDNQMKWDSTLGYADREGFRCGVCYEYSVFNILTRKTLRLKEKPLIAMDASLVGYQKHLTPEVVEKKIKLLIDRIKKYDGEFVFLWHNSSFNTNEWNAYEHIYQKVLA